METSSAHPNALPGVDKEGQAWGWLLQLERLNWREYGHERLDNQVIVRMCPGELDTVRGAPLVRVSVEHPGAHGRRIKGSGNSLAKAAEQLYAEFVRQNIRVPQPPVSMFF